jgi:hypothetical protein
MYNKRRSNCQVANKWRMRTGRMKFALLSKLKDRVVGTMHRMELRG